MMSYTEEIIIKIRKKSTFEEAINTKILFSVIKIMAFVHN